MHTQSFICGITVGACGVAICYRLVWHQRGAAAGKAGVSAPAESTIRLMTRLAIQHGAVNLSQGFPNEPPPRTMVLAAVGALLDGETLDSAEKCAKKLDALLPAAKPGGTALDSLNQYSYPFGVPMLRQAIQRYYGDFYPEVPADAEANLTVCLGATEGFAICLRAICKPEDTVAFFQPFHELYPNQCTIWGLTPSAVTLYESFEAARGWFFDEAELEEALARATCFLLNSPHNPTGKVFSRAELERIAALCIKHDVIVITDEIYEHMCYDGTSHTSIAQLPGMAERTIIVSAVSKTARATGWRVGWVVSPSRFTPTIRAVHDQLVLQAATPLQIGAAALLSMGRSHFETVPEEYLPKRALLLGALKRAGFAVSAAPQGAYYLFVGYRSVSKLAPLSPTEAAMKMITDYKVACVPVRQQMRAVSPGITHIPLPSSPAPCARFTPLRALLPKFDSPGR